MRGKIILVLLLLLLTFIGLFWLGSGSGLHATSLAAQQLEELRDKDLPALADAADVEPEEEDVFTHVLEEFYRTQDARYTDPATGMGLLHLACLFKKTELARCLLLDGADPNAHTAESDSPLLLAVNTALTPRVGTKELTELVDTLLAGGARFELSGRGNADFLTEAALLCEDEDTLLHLMQQGAKPDADTAMPLALHGWSRALEAVLQHEPRTDGLMHAAAAGAGRYKGRHTECMELLHRRGADVNELLENLPGATPLYELARELSAAGENTLQQDQAVAALVWLLQHGADPALRAEWDEEHPGFNPYNHLSMLPHIMAKLGDNGVELSEPELSFSSGLSLLAEVCRVAIAPPPAEQLAPHYDAIAALLTSPSPEMLSAEIYPQALAAALQLLASVDSARASRSVEDMLLWRLPVPPATEGEDALSVAARELQDTPGLAPSAEFLCRQAERLLQGGRAEEASVMVELLARCPHETAQEPLARYSEDARLPLQAGAYAARLYSAELPDARNNGVVSWLHEHKRVADSPFLQQAVLLTSLERLWFGQMPAQEQQQLLNLMRSIGAPRAAQAYEQIIRNLDKPEQLDALMAQGDDWKYELEIATARFFLSHRADFATP